MSCLSHSEKEDNLATTDAIKVQRSGKKQMDWAEKISAKVTGLLN